MRISPGGFVLFGTLGLVPTQISRRRGVEQAKPLLLGNKLELRAVGLDWLF